VQVSQPDQLQLVATVNPVRCHGDRNGSVVLSTTGGTAPFRYSLDGQQFIGSNTLIGLTAGTYGITVRDAEGCQNFTFANVTEPAPFSIDAGPDTWIVYGDSIPLVATVQNGIQPIEWNWYASFPGTLNCNDCASPYADPTYTIDYEVLAVDANGCESSDRLRVIVEKIRLVTVPTGFSPNGDGENDLLLVHGRPGSTILNFQIFDRWGELVWEARDFGINDPAVGWDGQFKGQEVDGGVYLWVIRVRHEDGEEEILRGQTTLIR
jgi:gliding motility-associated-like protein